MRKNRKSLGFTMAEMLIVVAIIAVLGGVSFIAVQRHQRSMAQLERNAIAKELFIAAQNHLTMAESQGYLLDNLDFGTKAQEQDKNGKQVDVWHVVGPSSGNILDQILPFGSIDETVRVGGSYLIRYQTNPAQVLDVFYVTTSGDPGRFNKEGGIKDDDYSDLMALRNNLPSSGYVLGWYGDVEALESGDIINAPTVEVENAERLIVKVTDSNNSNYALKLIIHGETSQANMAITLFEPSVLAPNAVGANNRFYGVNNEYTIILDDITNASAASPHDTSIMEGLHFADLNSFVDSSAGVLQFMQNEKKVTPVFIPGENITVQAVAYSNTSLTNIAYSSARTTNSLFADPGEAATTAMIGNFRHLENLDAAISGFQAKELGFTAAEQIADITWKDEDKDTPDFIQSIGENKGIAPVKVYTLGDSTGTTDNCYRPVNLTYALAYEGNSHAIEGIEVNYADDAGLFGSINVAGSSVSDLALIDFNIKSATGNAGALVGTLTQDAELPKDENGNEKPNVINVVAYNTPDFEDELKKTDATKTTIATASGNAGGLIGETEGGYCKVEKSAAALIVSSTGGNAGGLIGSSDGGTVTGCYSGGHTTDKKDENENVIGVWYGDPASTMYNVTASGIAGGLIGEAGATEIEYSYSTCSATGATVGGLIGTGSGNITSSYCTGLVVKLDSDGKPVAGISAGAFAAECSGTTTDCWYFEIINEFVDDAQGFDYLTPLPKTPTQDGTKDGVTAFDVDGATYDEFVGKPKTWKGAVPYRSSVGEDSTLAKYYQNEETKEPAFNLRTVAQLPVTADKSAERSLQSADDDDTEYFVATHYGDWPAPEIFVINAK